jgi:Flp pilus assembly pilin Flp
MRKGAGKGVRMKAKKIFSNFWKDERGQSTTEYILILSVVVMIAMKFKSKFGNVVSGMVDKLGSDLNQFNDGSN